MEPAKACKIRKYSTLASYELSFFPSFVETFGAWGSRYSARFGGAADWLPSCGADRRLKATQFLIQKNSIDVQRSNAAAVMATIGLGSRSLLLCPQNVDESACDDFVISSLTIFWLC